MGDVTIFKQAGAVSTAKRGTTALGEAMRTNDFSSRRIQTNTNGTFKRIVNGEQVGKAIRGEFNAIIAWALPKVSRSFYAKAYDPDGEATLPDCWSNLGDKPEANAPNVQAKTCMECPQNVKGSGGGERRACRFQRRVALLLEGDDSGELYQFSIPSKSLFGKGVGNTHPFESYVKFLIANHENPDTVVTNIAYDLDSDTMELKFTPVRGLTDEEYELVKEAQANPDAERYVKLTVAQTDGVKKKSAPQAEPEVEPKKPITRSEEPDEEEDPAPVKRTSKKTEEAPEKDKTLATTMSKWVEDKEEEEE